MENANPRPQGRPPRRLQQGRGEIRADALYPIRTLLKRLGVSRNTLTSLQRRGLKVHFLTRKSGLIDGRELIEFLRAEWQRESESGVDHVQQEESKPRP